MKKILNIAHRGFSSRYPENTMIAFREAIKLGADGFECDLRLSSDGRLVVFHDANLGRLCGLPHSIESLSWQEIQKLKVKGTEPIPSLEELLYEFHTTRINLEIKSSTRDSFVTEEVLRALTKIRPEGDIYISSFSHEVLNSFNVMDPDRKLARLGILVETAEIEKLPELSINLNPQTWNVPKQIFNSPWHQRWQAEKLPPLWAWTLDEPHEWRAALLSKLPVEAIISNKPDALHHFLSRFTAESGPS